MEVAATCLIYSKLVYRLHGQIPNTLASSCEKLPWSEVAMKLLHATLQTVTSSLETLPLMPLKNANSRGALLARLVEMDFHIHLQQKSTIHPTRFDRLAEHAQVSLLDHAHIPNHDI